MNVWLAPLLTSTAPVGEIEPPVPADAVMLYLSVLRAKLAPTLILLFMVIAQVKLVPEHAPDQPLKVELELGVAVSVTVVPAAKVVPVGLFVMVPLPAPDFVTDRV